MLLIFDLDGTLIDSRKDLAVATNRTREQFGLPPLDETLIVSYVGDGVGTLVRRAFGPETPENKIQQALTFFLDYYEDHCLDHTRLYEGVRETLAHLQEDGHTLAVLTNKPQQMSAKILDGVGVVHCFRRIVGGDSLPDRKPNPAGILLLLDQFGFAKKDTAMVGDSSVDVQTARNAGVAAWGVRWGFKPESFRKHPPDLFFDCAAELRTAPSQTQFTPMAE